MSDRATRAQSRNRENRVERELKQRREGLQQRRDKEPKKQKEKPEKLNSENWKLKLNKKKRSKSWILNNQK